MDKLQELKQRAEWVKQCPMEAAEIIEKLKGNEEILLEQNKKLRQQIHSFRSKTTYRVYKENLELAQEVARLKDVLPV
jgi:hypothetical protein